MNVVFSQSFLDDTDHLYASHASRFEADGFLLIKSVIDAGSVEPVLEAFNDIFDGKFETGAFPDSCQWQRGTSFEHLPRQALNGWKSDRRIARLVTAEPIAALAARLMGWAGARLATDSLWMKPPGWQAGGFHQDTIPAFDPRETITCWITLTPVSERNGSLVYARGSHRWKKQRLDGPDLKPGDRPQSYVTRLGQSQGERVEFHAIEAPVGSISFHNGLTWHGSHRNATDGWRNALGIHLIPADAQFAPEPGGFIFGRYKKNGALDLDENFFPVLSGQRSVFIDHYCQNGLCG
ncbi:MAG: phytanoyl-CoA dioxygenase family protein [Negativicutes bacterium]|nr:phytanoyl-CoA dioxygenase family protein [Negativicutes bacterium]